MEPSKFSVRWVTALLILNILDVIETLLIIKTGGHEVNPLLVLIMGHIDNTIAMISVKIIPLLILFAVHKHVPTLVWVGLTSIYLFVNIRSIVLLLSYWVLS